MSSSKQLATLQQLLNTGAPNPNAPDTLQRILDEDAYIDTLQHIITRDFYPDLHKLNKQNQNIELFGSPGKVATPTPIKQHKHQQNNNNKASSPKPKTFENDITPTPNQQSSHNHNKQQNDDLMHYVNGQLLSNGETQTMKDLTLKQFQNVYTSEDNYSFSEIMYKNQLQHYSKYPWIYQQQKHADDRQKYLSILQSQNTNNATNTVTANISPKAVTLPSISTANSTKLTNVTAQNQIQQTDEKKHRDEQALIEKVDLYRGELQFWKFKAVNKLMFFPEADREQNLELMKKLHAEYGKPECVYNNTRLPATFKLPAAQPKLSEMEQNLKGYSMVLTPNVTMELQQDAAIVLDADNKPVTPLFHIAKVPKKDKIVHALNKRNADKLRKKQERKLRNATPGTQSVYTPYSTRQILTPSGHHIDTPLVGLGAINDRNRNRIYKHNEYGRGSSRRVEMLSPAARKLMEKNIGMNGKCTPLSSVLRDAYSSTPRAGTGRGRKRRRKELTCTPKLIVDACTPNASKKRKLDENVFKKPTHSIRHGSRKGKSEDLSNITDGLL